MDSSKMNKLTDLVSSCLLPELNYGIDENCISNQDFNEFRKFLNTNLIILFDAMQQFTPINEYFASDDNETKEFRINLILLLCEQTGTNIFYQTDEVKLLNRLELIREHYFNQILCNIDILTAVLKFYKTKLTSKNWKKNYGAIYGFMRFCDLYYKKPHRMIDLDIALFILSVGTILIEENYEELYKQMGIELYWLLLNNVEKIDMISSNINEAIFQKLLNVRHNINTNTISTKIWDCLLKCLTFNRDKTFENLSNWNKLDMIFENIIEINQKDVIQFFLYVSKFSCIDICNLKNPNQIECNEIIISATDYETVNESVLKQVTDNCWNDEKDIIKLREIMINYHNNFHIYRWINKIFNIMINRLDNLLTETLAVLLRAMHICYITCIYPIPIKIVALQLYKFSNNFPNKLISIAETYKKDIFITREIRSIVETVNLHLQTYTECDDNNLLENGEQLMCCK